MCERVRIVCRQQLPYMTGLTPAMQQGGRDRNKPQQPLLPSSCPPTHPTASVLLHMSPRDGHRSLDAGCRLLPPPWKIRSPRLRTDQSPNPLLLVPYHATRTVTYRGTHHLHTSRLALRVLSFTPSGARGFSDRCEEGDSAAATNICHDPQRARHRTAAASRRNTYTAHGGLVSVYCVLYAASGHSCFAPVRSSPCFRPTASCPAMAYAMLQASRVKLFGCILFALWIFSVCLFVCLFVCLSPSIFICCTCGGFLVFKADCFLFLAFHTQASTEKSESLLCLLHLHHHRSGPGPGHHRSFSPVREVCFAYSSALLLLITYYSLPSTQGA